MRICDIIELIIRITEEELAMEIVNREMIIPRKKSISIRNAVLLLVLAAVFLFFFGYAYFFDVPWMTSKPPLVAVVLTLLITPVLFFCGIGYVKQIFNENPILIINERGIHEQMSRNSVGLIKWEDIEKVNVIPYMDNTHWVCIILKRPEKYITDQKRLSKLSRQKGTAQWGHVTFSSLYFKKKINEVAAVIQYYLGQYREECSF
jgi:hypothetical protein